MEHLGTKKHFSTHHVNTPGGLPHPRAFCLGPASHYHQLRRSAVPQGRSNRSADRRCWGRTSHLPPGLSSTPGLGCWFHIWIPCTMATKCRQLWPWHGYNFCDWGWWKNITVRRKFRSQTSDNMDRWKAEQGRGTEKRKIRREKGSRERVRRKKMQMREKVRKSRNTVFFQWFAFPEGRKVGSLKRRVRSQVARWEMKKVHAVVARSTFPSQNVQNTWASDHLEVEMSKKCTP